MITKEIAFPVGVPAPVAVRLGIMAFTVTGRTAFLLTVTDPFFPLLCGSADRSPSPGKSQMLGINQSFANRLIKELLLVKAENEKKGFSGFKRQRSSKGRSLEAVLEESQGVLSPFFFPLGGFILGNRSLGERLLESSCQTREKKS